MIVGKSRRVHDIVRGSRSGKSSGDSFQKRITDFQGVSVTLCFPLTSSSCMGPGTEQVESGLQPELHK